MGEQYYSNDEVLEFLQKDIKYPGAEEPRMAVDVILGFRINLYIYASCNRKGNDFKSTGAIYLT